MFHLLNAQETGEDKTFRILLSLRLFAAEAQRFIKCLCAAPVKIPYFTIYSVLYRG
jgi:hypothetical protein